MSSKQQKKSIGDRLDNLIGIVSPERAVRRRAWRQAGQEQQRYAANVNRGASTHRGMAGWTTSGGSANADILDDLPALRARSRDLIANSGRAGGIMTTLVTNVIGTGIWPQPRLDHEMLGISEERARKIERQMAALFKVWAPHADAGRKLSYFGLQRQAYRCKKVNGEYVVLPRMVDHPRRMLSLCLHAVESDRLATPLGVSPAEPVYEGVRVGRFNEPVEYYIQKTHPGDDQWASAEFETIPAEDSQGRKLVYHEFDVTRPEQTRGLPAFSAVLDEFHDLDEYREAERYAMRMAACIGLIINQESDDGISGDLTTIDGQPVEGLEPGMLWRGKDLDIHQITPNRPGNNFEAFVRDIDKVFGLSQGIGYELASKYFSDANYSSIRAGFLEARRFFKVEQVDFKHFFCQPTWERFVEEAYLRSLLDLPRFYDLFPFWVQARHVPMGWDWVDPEKEVNAEIKAIDAGLQTVAESVAGRTGGDWVETLRQRGKEEKMKAENGVPTSIMGTITTRNNVDAISDDEDSGEDTPAPKPREESDGE